MDPVVIGLGVCIVVIVLLLFMGWNCCRGDYEKYLEGMWRGDDDFCAESGVSSMLMYIGAASSRYGKVTRDGYLIINNDVCNQAIKMTYRRPYVGFWKLGVYQPTVNMTYDETAVMPEKVTFHVDMINGCLKIYQGKQMYGVFYKDHELTNLSHATD